MVVQIRGAVVKARKSFVEKHFGAGAWERVTAALPQEDRELFKGLLVYAGWYPFEVGARLDQAIVDVFGGGKTKVFEDIGVQSAADNLNGVHHSFLTPGDPQAFLGQSKTIYKFYYNTGHREYKATGRASGVITTHGAEMFSLTDCLTVVGWHKQALAMCGAKNVRIDETQCRAKGDPICSYRLEWDM
jgi:uncharacterized protein (TIGR02265 family)